MNVKSTKAFILRVLLWLLLALGLPFTVDSLKFVWLVMPYYYVLVCVFLFLDIKMPEMMGLEIAAEIGQLPYIIFSTAYPKYAI